MANSVTLTDLGNAFELVARGKVRDLYAIDSETLLFVATDRISAYDTVMNNGIPGKGVILTLLSAHWISILSNAIPNLETHFLSLNIPAHVPEKYHEQLRDRCMQVRRLYVFPIEAIVRGYMTGSAWKEYQTRGTVHGIKMPPGLQESQELPSGVMYTPSTKAEAGGNDENIHPERAAEIVGERYAKRIEELAIRLYCVAKEYALERGIIIADTKFEFGLDAKTDEVVLVDEVITPDSSRFWPASSYAVGVPQHSFDKQYLRDWLTREGLKGKHGIDIPVEIVRNTSTKYQDAYTILVGRPPLASLGKPNA